MQSSRESSVTMGVDKMNIIIVVLSTMAVMLYTAHSVNGIACFQCNSARDPNCAEIVDNSTENPYYRECEPKMGLKREDFFCRTITQTIKDRGNLVRVVRSCGWEKHKRECYENEDEDHMERVCQCFENGCNSRASSTVLNAAILAALVMVPALAT